MIQSLIKPSLCINVLHNLQSQLIVRDLNSFVNAISDGDSLTSGGGGVASATIFDQ